MKALPELCNVIRYDIKVFFRYRINVVWLIVTPIVYAFIGYLLSTMYGAERFAETTSGAPSGFLYGLVGYAVFSLSNFCWQSGGAVENAMRTGVARTNFALPIRRSSYLYGMCLGTLCTNGIFTLIMFVTSIILAGTVFLNIVFALFFLLLSIFYFLGISLCMSSLALLYKNVGNIANILTFLMQLLTGLMIPINSLPQWLRVMSHICPTTWAIDSVRSQIMGIKPLQPVSTALLVLVGSAMLSNLLGAYALKKATEKMERMNLLDGY